MADQFSQPAPSIANDPQYCNSTIFFDGFSEALKIKTLLRLISPNKELGGKQGFMIVTSLDRFLGTIRIMLASVRLRGTEVGLFKIPEDRNIIAPLIDVLAQIRKLTDDLQTQFEEMQSPHDSGANPRRE